MYPMVNERWDCRVAGPPIAVESASEYAALPELQ